MRQISLLVRFFVLLIVLSPLPGNCLFKITEDDQAYTLKSTLDEELEDLILPKKLGLQFHLHGSKPSLQRAQESDEDEADDDKKDDEEEAFESIPIVHKNNINLILNPGDQALIDHQTALISSSPLEGCQFVKQTATFNDFIPQNFTDLNARVETYLEDKQGAHPYSKEVTLRAISEIVECHKTLDQPEKLNKLKNILIKYPDIKQCVEDTFPKIAQQGSRWIIVK